MFGQFGFLYGVHGILWNQSLLLGKGEDSTQGAVMVLHILGTEPPFRAKVCQESLKVQPLHLLEGMALKVVDDVPHGVLIEGDCLWFMGPILHAEREPGVSYKGSKVRPEAGRFAILRLLGMV